MTRKWSERQPVTRNCHSPRNRVASVSDATFFALADHSKPQSALLLPARIIDGRNVFETDSSHVPMLSNPDLVLDVIRKAANAVRKAAQSALEATATTA
jgi:hypothetical protein